MFAWHARVYYEDTDASGVVYHARYLAFFERARTELLRSAGFSQQELLEREKVAFTISRIQVDYRKPARLDDELLIQTTIEPGRALIEFDQHLLRQPDGELLATARVKAGCVDLARFRPQRIPSHITEALRAQTKQ